MKRVTKRHCTACGQQELPSDVAECPICSDVKIARVVTILCEHCNHVWKPKYPDIMPSRCPRCNRTDYYVATTVKTEGKKDSLLIKPTVDAKRNFKRACKVVNLSMNAVLIKFMDNFSAQYAAPIFYGDKPIPSPVNTDDVHQALAYGHKLEPGQTVKECMCGLGHSTVQEMEEDEKPLPANDDAFPRKDTPPWSEGYHTPEKEAVEQAYEHQSITIDDMKPPPEHWDVGGIQTAEEFKAERQITDDKWTDLRKEEAKEAKRLTSEIKTMEDELAEIEEETSKSHRELSQQLNDDLDELFRG